MKKKFKIAIVGAGHIAQTFHIPAWIRSKKCEIISLCDKNSLKLKLMSKKFSINSKVSSAINWSFLSDAFSKFITLVFGNGKLR